MEIKSDPVVLRNLLIETFGFRVRTDRNGGAWCPLKQATTEPEEWVQIDLKSVHMITATGTQGRFGNGVGIEYAEAYMVKYWRPRLSNWIRYHMSNGEEVLTDGHSFGVNH